MQSWNGVLGCEINGVTMNYNGRQWIKAMDNNESECVIESDVG
jgi:hypothetical protein